MAGTAADDEVEVVGEGAATGPVSRDILCSRLQRGRGSKRNDCRMLCASLIIGVSDGEGRVVVDVEDSGDELILGVCFVLCA